MSHKKIMRSCFLNLPDKLNLKIIMLSKLGEATWWFDDRLLPKSSRDGGRLQQWGAVPERLQSWWSFGKIGCFVLLSLKPVAKAVSRQALKVSALWKEVTEKKKGKKESIKKQYPEFRSI